MKTTIRPSKHFCDILKLYQKSQTGRTLCARNITSDKYKDKWVNYPPGKEMLKAMLYKKTE